MLRGKVIRRSGGLAGKFTPCDEGSKVRREQLNRHFSKEDADICLNCTKAKCSSEQSCFAKMKKIGVVEDD